MFFQKSIILLFFFFLNIESKVSFYNDNHLYSYFQSLKGGSNETPLHYFVHHFIRMSRVLPWQMNKNLNHALICLPLPRFALFTRIIFDYKSIQMSSRHLHTVHNNAIWGKLRQVVSFNSSLIVVSFQNVDYEPF